MIRFCDPPSFPPTTYTGAKRAGLNYEKKVEQWLTRLARELGWELYSHCWLAEPLCQPDFVLESPAGCCIVVEAKLTQVDCYAQIEKYKRALKVAGAEQVTGIQVCRRVRYFGIKDFESLTDHDHMLLWI